MKDLIKTGIVGFGLSGKVFHAPFIHTHPAFQLSAVVERHHRHAEMTYPYIRTLKHYTELLKDTSVDLIVLAIPNIHHYPMVKASLEAGKHVVVEKPFVPGSKEADELIKISEKTVSSAACLFRRKTVHSITSRQCRCTYFQVARLHDKTTSSIGIAESHIL